MPWIRDRKKTIRLAGLCAIPLAGAAALYWLRDPIAEHTRSWRSAHNLRQANSHGEEAEWDKAYQHALVARQLNPQSIEALRVLVKASFNSRSVRTLDYANALFLNPKSTREDKLFVLGILQQAEDHVGFVRLYNLLPKETRQDRDFVILRVQFLIKRNAFDSAKEILEAEIGKKRDRQHLLLLASLLVQPTASQEELERGQRLIEELANVDNADEIARTAFQLLGFIDPSRIQPELLGDLGLRISTKDAGTPAEYLAAASLALAASKSPTDRRAIIEQAIEAQRGIAPGQLAAWLTQIGHDEDILEFLTEERGLSSPELYQQRFLALIRIGKVEEAEAWLAQPPHGVEAINIWLARAQLSRLKQEKTAESNAWEQAFQVAETTAHRNEYLRIFEVASKAERVDLATRALLKAPSHPTGILPPAADAVAPMIHLTESNRLEDLLYLTEALAAREPDNALLVNNLVYLNLLLGRKLDASVAQATQLVDRLPESLSLRTTLALGLLLKEDPAGALSTLPPAEAEVWKRASAADRAIRALVLEKMGRTDEAKAVRDEVVLEDLTAVERRLLFPEKKDAPPEGTLDAGATAPSENATAPAASATADAQ